MALVLSLPVVGTVGAAAGAKLEHRWVYVSTNLLVGRNVQRTLEPLNRARGTGRYYLVKGDGPWYGSWKGLPPEVIVVNWHGHQPGRLESLKHFAARGHRQILAGYYDHPPERITDWLRDAAKVKGVIGAMYTTWRRNYDDLETFAQRLRSFAVKPHPARD